MKSETSIEYVYEDVNRKTILDGEFTKNPGDTFIEIRKKIDEMAKIGGVDETSTYIVEYSEYVDDNNNTKVIFSVIDSTIRKVPCKVEKTVVFTYDSYDFDYTLDDVERKDAILKMASDVGIDTSNYCDFEVSFDEVIDGKCDVVVYSVKRTKLVEVEQVPVEDNEQHFSDLQLKSLKREVEELKELRTLVGDIEDNSDAEELINMVQDNINSLDKSVNNATKMTPILEEELNRVSTQITKIKKKLDKDTKDYEEAYAKLEEILKIEKDKIEKSKSTEKELKKIKDKYGDTKAERLSKLEKKNKKVTDQRKRLTDLTKKSTRIKNILKQVEALDLTVNEYYKISKILEKTAIMSLIYKKKGLEDIIKKSAKKRTLKEKETLKLAKNEVIEEIAKVQKEQAGLSIIQAIEFLYTMDIQYSNDGKKVRVTDLSSEAIDNIKDKVANSSVKIVNNRIEKIDYKPGAAPKDMVDCFTSKIIIREESNTGSYYVDNSVLKRFRLSSVGTKLKLDNEYYNCISSDDVNFIVSAANNHYSPYDVEFKKIDVNSISNKNNSKDSSIEKIIIYRDDSQKAFYVNDYVMRRFNLEDNFEVIKVKEEILHKIDESDYIFIVNNGDNKYSPYVVDNKNINVTSNDIVDRDRLDQVETIFFFIDKATKDCYVQNHITRRFNLVPASEGTIIDGIWCYKILPEDASYITENANNKYSPYIIDTKELDIENKDNNKEYEEEVDEEFFNTYYEQSLERIVIYSDNNNNKYVRKYTVKRFNLIPISTLDEVMLEGSVFYPILDTDASYIVENANNKYSPYKVDKRSFKLENSEVRKVNHAIDTNNIVKRIVIYRDLDNNNDVYVKEYVVKEFNLIPIGEETEIDNEVCYKIDNEDAINIITNAHNESSPYEIDVNDIELGSRISFEFELEEEDSDAPRSIRPEIAEIITIYHDMISNDVYVKKNILDRFNLKARSEEIRIDNAICCKIDEEDVEYIIGNSSNSYSPYEVLSRNVTLEVENTSVSDKNSSDLGLEIIVLYKDVNSTDSVYAKDSVVKRFRLEDLKKTTKDNEVFYRLNLDDFDFIVGNANNKYSPYEIKYENISVTNKENIDSDFEFNKLYIYKDGDNYYTNNYVISRFHLDTTADKIRINKKYYSQIFSEDVDYIINNANNKYSPYEVILKEVNIDSDKISVDIDKYLGVENIVIYKDVSMENGNYVNGYVVNRFHLNPENDNKVMIGNDFYYKVSEDDIDFIIGAADNKYSSYKVVIKNVLITEYDKVDNVKFLGLEVIVVYEDLSNNNALYVDKETIKRFNKTSISDSIIFDNKELYQISFEDFDMIASRTDNKYSPYKIKKIKIDTDIDTKIIEDELVNTNTNKDDKAIDHVEYIMYKTIHNDKDEVKKYTPNNLKVTKSFIKELKTGDYSYNIIHILEPISKVTDNLINILSSKIINSSKAKSIKENLRNVLTNLSDEEYNILFDEYKNSTLKNNVDNEINSIILDGLKSYALFKLEKLNNMIADDFQKLQKLISKIDKITDEDKYNELYVKAYDYVLKIIENRREVENILSSELYGLEEAYNDNKENLPYIEYYSKDFSSEQEKYQKNLSRAIAKDDCEEAVKNFIEIERLSKND